MHAAAAPVESMSLPDFLKQETMELHVAAERHPGHGAMFRGMAPFDLYVDQSAQTLLVMRALERAVARHRAHPAFAGLVHDYHVRSPVLSADLAACGRDPAKIEPLPSTRAMLDRIESASLDDPTPLLGVLYVLEGSTNGAKFIQKALLKAYRRQDTTGMAWLDPHGDAQQERWQLFRKGLAERSLNDQARARVLESARATFAWTIAVLDELTAGKARN